MFVIENGFTYIAFLMFLCGGLLALQKYAKWKIFDIMPPLVWIYLIGLAALFHLPECFTIISSRAIHTE